MARKPFERRSIPLRSIKPPESPRKLDEGNINRLASSIAEFGGVLQPIGVIPQDEWFRLVWGNHRVQACRKAGMSEIDALLLPVGTTPADEIAYSIQENALRTDEYFADTLARVEHHARFLDVSVAEAAELNHLKPPFISKCRKVGERLTPEVQNLARERNMGLTVLYEIAKAKDGADQMRFLTAYIKGEMTRDDIARAIKQTNEPPTKQLTFRVTVDTQKVEFTVPADCTYDRVGEVLNTLKAKFQHYRKQEIPLELLPNILK